MKNVLIVSPFFAPENSTASVRFSKIAKCLQQLGYNITVICTQMDADMKIDETLVEDLKALKNVNRVNYSNTYYKLKRRFGVEGSTQSKGKSLAKDDVNNKINQRNKRKDILVCCYSNAFCYLLGRKYIRFIKERKQTYDVVISTFAPLSSHMLGYYMKKKGLCKKWIADFRDSMTTLTPESAVGSIVKKYGTHLVKRADYITCVSEGTVKKVTEETSGRFGNLSSKMRVITNGFDIEDRKVIQNLNVKDDKLVFVYCGTLYNIGGKLKTNITPLFKALADLDARGKIDKNKIEIRYAGYDSELFVSLAGKHNMDDITKCYGRISRDQSLRLQREGDVILVPVWNNKGEEGILSGKFFETLLVQRNVLCLVTGNLRGSELASIVRETECGYAYEEINKDQSGLPQLEEWILNIYNEKMTNGELAYKSVRADKYSHQSLARQFANLFDM